MRTTLLFLFALMTVALSAQKINEMPPAMVRALESWPVDEPVNIFVSAPAATLAEWENVGRLRHWGGVKGYELISIAPTELKALVYTTELTYLEVLWTKGRPLNDRMLINNNVMPVHQGVGIIGRELRGEGVMMGIIDTGIELDHGDFKDEEEVTRVRQLWDMTVEIDQEHLSDYGYGSVWNTDQIEAGEALLHRDQPQWFGHGSTVSGSACADGSAVGNFGGVAPLTDIAVVSFDFDRPDFLPTMIQATQFLVDAADEAEMPLVINASLGTYYGSHDGLDPTALYIDSLLEARPGMLFVAAAGNSQGLAPYHIRIPAGDHFTYLEAENGLGASGPGMLIEWWADQVPGASSMVSLRADSLAGDTLVTQALGSAIPLSDMMGQVVTDSLFFDDGELAVVVQYWAQERGDQLQFQIYAPFVADPSLVYGLSLEGGLAWDAWSTSTFGSSDIVSSGLDGVADQPLMIGYIAPDDEQKIVSSWACSERVITVANYVNRNEYTDVNGQLVQTGGTVGAIASTSSHGPTRQGLQKPDVASSGSIALSAGDEEIIASLINTEPFKVALGGKHHRNGGTSMASPVVAGVAALFLQQCPESSWSDFRTAIHDNSATDTFTGLTPSITWGYGKLNAFATIASSSLQVEVDEVGGMLTASAAESYQWYLDGEEIDGATAQTITIDADGVYSVRIIDTDGCVAFSAPIFYTDLSETGHWQGLAHRYAEGRLSVSGLQPGDRVDVYDAIGRSLGVYTIASQDRIELDLSSTAPGMTHLVVSRNGRFWTQKLLRR